MGCVPQQPATSTLQGVSSSRRFPCYERNDCNTPFQVDRIGHEAATEWVANAPAPVHSEAAGPSVSELVVPDAAVEVGHENTATFEQTGDPLLLIVR